ncbi:elongation factor P 5-aminopentanone reductase [Ectobacillus ponti]|uniref:SDR family oxidoreductase n=1 Tax=Ectobacillus ponti TaxID=2961894 RepID=A0AA41X5C7_9BACI|nr:SDR family oxidoreductase [Ectobacillus ponti]MCP8969062.1 SDR family oxidoreductase [Ectobacillus ponti]
MKKYALVTGASGGIGGAAARQLAADGFAVYVHYHRGDAKIRELLQSMPPDAECYPVQADLSAASGAAQLLGQIHHELDAFVYAAGKSLFGLVTDTSDDELAGMIQLQVSSLYKLGQALLPAMIRRRAGSMVIISSIWGQTGASCEVPYSMVKGAQNAYVKALAKEVAPSGVRVNAIAPGAIDTDMLHMFSAADREDLASDIPMGRLGAAKEVAEAVSFLISPRSSYITGQVIGVNGGWHC